MPITATTCKVSSGRESQKPKIVPEYAIKRPAIITAVQRTSRAAAIALLLPGSVSLNPGVRKTFFSSNHMIGVAHEIITNLTSKIGLSIKVVALAIASAIPEIKESIKPAQTKGYKRFKGWRGILDATPSTRMATTLLTPTTRDKPSVCMQRNVGKASNELDSRIKVESEVCSRNSSNPIKSSRSKRTDHLMKATHNKRI